MTLSAKEENWAFFYNYLTDVRNNDKKDRENRYEEKFEQWLEDLAKSEKEDSRFFFSNNKFNEDTYFKLLFSLRMLNVASGGKTKQVEFLHERGETDFSKEAFECYLDRIKLNLDYNIPNKVIEYFRWWVNIGLTTDSVIDNILNENFIQNPKVPYWIKIHILSRFIMRRNSALTGSKNFEPNTEIVKDSEEAEKVALKILEKAKEGSTKFQKNNFYNTRDIETLLMIEKLLLKVRSDKDIDRIIKDATITLGYSLTSTNRLWGAIVGFWCNHVLWRCFVCKGEAEIAETFEDNSKSLIKYSEKKFGIKMSGAYRKEFIENYGKNIARDHYKRLKIIINMEKIPIYTNKDKINKELKEAGILELNVKDDKKLGNQNQLMQSRIIFYEKFVGLNDRPSLKIKTAGRPTTLFGESQRRGNWEQRIEQIPIVMEDFTNYLHTSPNIVAIPTIRLVIIDLLLLLSRLLVSLNPDEKNPKKGFSSAESLSTEEQEDKLIQIRKQYDELVEPTIERVWDCIKSTKNRLEFDIGEERLFDLKTIIDDLDKSKWKKNKELVSKFTIYKSDGRRDIQEATTARNMGIKIQNLLKKLTNEREEIELYFPIKMILDGTLGRERR